MKIFITGIAGFLGSHLAKRLLELGHEIYGNDNLIGGEITNLENKKIKFYETDCCDLEKMTEIIPKQDVSTRLSFVRNNLVKLSQNNYIDPINYYSFVNKIKFTDKSKINKAIASLKRGLEEN